MYSIEELANDFRKLGIGAGDTVMLHASVRAVGEVAGGPDAIHLALKSALTSDGTLMMYANCPRYYDEVGHPCWFEQGHFLSPLLRTRKNGIHR